MDEIKLTQFSHSSGCGCKIAPDVLEKILKSERQNSVDPKLLVGYGTKDDAAVYDIGNDQALISSVDFFMPIVDDAYDFGRIAAANAISDIYAMGAKPILATAILGWPVNKLPPELAQKVLEGARKICEEAGIPLAGGHSIDALEPIFGLSVNGITKISQIKKNSGAKKDDLIYLTKKIGVGILATALKRGKIKPEHKTILSEQLIQLNKFGERLGPLTYVNAVTDITGFGFLGHLIEMAEGADLSAEINYEKVPMIAGLEEYTSQMIAPDNLYRNWNHAEKKVSNIGPQSFFTLNDPQTNGGLMISIDPSGQKDLESLMKEYGLAEFAFPIGKMVAPEAARVILR
jgi:selenide,water dikinase